MIKLYLLSFFSKNAKVKLGENVWAKLDAQLPKAHGVIEDDKPRMKQFSKLLKDLSRHRKKALKSWLEKQIHDLEYCFPDLCTGSEEEYRRKWLQIYDEHLRILKSKTP